MPSLLDHLLGEHGYLGGIAIADGKRRGAWRPGHRSVEIALAARKAQLQKQSKKSGKQFNPSAGGALGQNVKKILGGTRTGPSAGGATPGKAIGGSGAPSPGSGIIRRIGGGAPTPTPKPKGRVLRGMLGVLAGGFLDGLGDDLAASAGAVSSSGDGTDPNAGGPSDRGATTVWVTAQPMPLYWRGYGQLRKDMTWRQRTYDQGVDSPPNEPVLYPDGTPIVGRLWLPMMDCSQFNGDAYGYRVRRYMSNSNPQARETWHAQNPHDELFYMTQSSHAGAPSPTGDDVAYLPNYQYLASNGTDITVSNPLGIGSSSSQTDPSALITVSLPSGVPSLVKQGGDWVTGFPAYQYEYWDMPCSFDWSDDTKSPTVQAYPFCYDNFGSDLIGWVQQSADLYRSDGKSLGDGGTLFLPGPPWVFACLEFMDALIQGAHGLPHVVDDNGVIDLRAFSSWCSSNPPWDTLVKTGPLSAGTFLLATVYDNQPVQIPSATPPAPTPPTDIPAPADGSTPTDGSAPIGADQQPTITAPSDQSLIDQAFATPSSSSPPSSSAPVTLAPPPSSSAPVTRYTGPVYQPPPAQLPYGPNGDYFDPGYYDNGSGAQYDDGSGAQYDDGSGAQYDDGSGAQYDDGSGGDVQFDDGFADNVDANGQVLDQSVDQFSQLVDSFGFDTSDDGSDASDLVAAADAFNEGEEGGGAV